jgi:hypothetical protein
MDNTTYSAQQDNAIYYVQQFILSITGEMHDIEKLKRFALNIKTRPGISELDYVTYVAIQYINKLNGHKVDTDIPKTIKQTLTEIINTRVDDADEAVLSYHNRKTADVIKKKITNISQMLGFTSIPQMIKALNPEASYYTKYLVFDTKYARFLDDNTRMQWDIVNSLQESVGDTSSSVNVVGEIRNIVEIRIHSFIIPKFAINEAQNRATLFIEELGSQCFLLPNGLKFHWVGFLNDVEKPIPLGLRSALTTAYFPDFPKRYNFEALSGYRFNEGRFRFNPPITELRRATISIGDPFSKISMPYFRINNCTLNSLTPTGDDISVEFEIITPVPHFIEEPDVTGLFSLRIFNFTTTDPVADAEAITYMNTHEFTKVNITNNTTIRVRAIQVRKLGAPDDMVINFIKTGTGTAFDDVLFSITGDIQPFSVEVTSLRSVITMEVVCQEDDNDLMRNRLVY